MTDRNENAVKEGLFTRRDFIREDERPEYEEFRTGLLECLNPQSPLEQNYADEIVSSQWRLRRCRLIEGVLGTRASEEFLLSPEDEERQKSVDRARSHALNALRKASAELRKVQTERECRIAYTFGRGWGLCDSGRVLAAHTEWRKELDAARAKDTQAYKEMLERELGPLPPAEPEDDDTCSFCNSASAASEPVPAADSFCKTGPRPVSADSFCKNTPITVQKVGRNEPCPCGSGLKYKRCCIDGPKRQAKQAA